MQTAVAYMLDTNVFSVLMRESNAKWLSMSWARLMACRAGSVSISVVVEGELNFGAAKNPSVKRSGMRDSVMAHLDKEPETLSREVAHHYGEIRAHLERLGQGMSPLDLWIAAHARALGATLVTADAAFQRVPGLRVENWLSRGYPMVSEALAGRYVTTPSASGRPPPCAVVCRPSVPGGSSPRMTPASAPYV